MQSRLSPLCSVEDTMARGQSAALGWTGMGQQHLSERLSRTLHQLVATLLTAFSSVAARCLVETAATAELYTRGWKAVR